MSAFLLLLKPHAALIGALVIIPVCSFALGYHLGRPHPTAAIQVAHVATQQAEAQAAKTDTHFVTQTHTVTKLIATVDTMLQHDTVEKHLTDTVWVKQEVAACSALKNACQAFRDTALALRVADSSVIHALHTEVSAWQSSQPSFVHKAVIVTGMFLAGAATHQYLIHH